MASQSPKLVAQNSEGSVHLESFLVDLYVRIEGKIWEQDAHFNAVKRNLLENVLRRPGDVPLDRRRALAKSMNQGKNAEDLRAAIAQYIDVKEDTRLLWLSVVGSELVANTPAGLEEFRAPCPSPTTVGDLDTWLQSFNLVAGTYGFYINGLRESANTTIDDFNTVSIKEVISKAPRRGPASPKNTTVGKGAVTLRSSGKVGRKVSKNTHNGLPEPPQPETGTDVTQMDSFETIALLRQCVAGLQGFEKVLHTIDIAERDAVMKRLVRQDQGSGEGSSALAHVFSLDPVVVPGVCDEIATVSNKLASAVGEHLGEKLRKTPSTQHLMEENNAERKKIILDEILKNIQHEIRRVLRNGQRDPDYFKWQLESYCKIRIICDIVQDGDLFVVTGGYLRILDGLKGKLRDLRVNYEVPRACLNNKILGDSPDVDAKKTMDGNIQPIEVDHEAEMKFSLNLQFKVLTANVSAMEEVNVGALQLRAKDKLAFFKKAIASSGPLVRLK